MYDIIWGGINLLSEREHYAVSQRICMIGAKVYIASQSVSENASVLPIQIFEKVQLKCVIKMNCTNILKKLVHTPFIEIKITCIQNNKASKMSIVLM